MSTLLDVVRTLDAALRGSDPQQANSVLRLLEIMETDTGGDGDSAEVYREAAHACYRFFSRGFEAGGPLATWISRKQKREMKLKLKARSDEPDPEPMAEKEARMTYAVWMRDNLQLFRDNLTGVGLRHIDLDVRGLALQMLMKLVKLDSTVTSASTSTSATPVIDNDLLIPIVRAFLSVGGGMPDEVLELADEHYLCHIDVATLFLRDIQALLGGKEKEKQDETGAGAGAGADSKVRISSVIDLLLRFKRPDAESPSLFVGTGHNSGSGSSKKQKTGPGSAPASASASTSTFTDADWKRAFQGAWMALIALSSGMTAAQRRKVLVALPTHVLPSLREPAALLDFVTDAYDEGGAMAVLSLEALFILITQHKLDYPRFFSRLYALLTPVTAHAPHANRFMTLCDRVLTSTHVPSYVAAAFLKRLIRFALFAPPHVLLHVVPICHNTMRSHPVCTVLVHRGEESGNVNLAPSATAGAGDGVLAIGSGGFGFGFGSEMDAFRDDGDTTDGTNPKRGKRGRKGKGRVQSQSQSQPQPQSSEPFDSITDDPAKCAAAASSLWELEAVKRHYFAPVSRSGTVLEAPIKTTAPAQAMPAAGGWARDYRSLIERAMQYRPRVKGKREEGPAPLAHVLPVGLWDGMY